MTDDDIEAESIENRSPLLFRVSDLEACVVGLPVDFPEPATGPLRFANAANGEVMLGLQVRRIGVVRAAVLYKECPSQFKDRFQADVQSVIACLEKALGDSGPDGAPLCEPLASPTSAVVGAEMRRALGYITDYDYDAPEQERGQAADQECEEDQEPGLRNALRYIPDYKTADDKERECFIEESCLLPAVAFRVQDGEVLEWPGTILCTPEQIAFLEDEDFKAEEIEDRCPLILESNDFADCVFRLPPGFPEHESKDDLTFMPSPDNDAYMSLTVDRGTLNVRFMLDLWDAGPSVRSRKDLELLVARVSNHLNRSIDFRSVLGE